MCCGSALSQIVSHFIAVRHRSPEADLISFAQVKYGGGL